MSSNKNKNEQHATQSKAGEVVINRLLLMFMLSVVGIVVLLYMGRMNVAQTVWLYKSQLPLVLLILTGLLFVGSVVLFVKNRKDLVHERKKTINSVNLLCSSAFVFLCTLYLKFPGNVSYTTIASRLLVLLVAVTILYFVFYLYQREFFIVSLLTALAGTGVYYSVNTAINVALLIFALLILIAAISLKAKNGTMKFKSKKIKIIDGKTYLPFFILSLLILIVAVFTLVLSGMNIYGLIAIFAYYLITGIYYTVKLM